MASNPNPYAGGTPYGANPYATSLAPNNPYSVASSSANPYATAVPQAQPVQNANPYAAVSFSGLSSSSSPNPYAGAVGVGVASTRTTPGAPSVLAQPQQQPPQQLYYGTAVAPAPAGVATAASASSSSAGVAATGSYTTNVNTSAYMNPYGGGSTAVAAASSFPGQQATSVYGVPRPGGGLVAATVSTSAGALVPAPQQPPPKTEEELKLEKNIARLEEQHKRYMLKVRKDSKSSAAPFSTTTPSGTTAGVGGGTTAAATTATTSTVAILAAKKIQDFVRRMARKKRFKELLQRSMKRRQRLLQRDKLQQNILLKERELSKMKRFLSDTEYGGYRAVNDLISYTEVEAALKIQKVYRGFQIRKIKVSLMTASFKHRFIVKMQRLFRKRKALRQARVSQFQSMELFLKQKPSLVTLKDVNPYLVHVQAPVVAPEVGDSAKNNTSTSAVVHHQHGPEVYRRPMSLDNMRKVEEKVAKKLDHGGGGNNTSTTSSAGANMNNINTSSDAVISASEQANLLNLNMDIESNANYAAELEERAHECYLKFNKEAVNRRKEASRLALQKLQAKQMTSVMEYGKLGDPRYVNLNMAPAELLPEAMERHKRRQLEWMQRNASGKQRARMTRKEAVALSFPAAESKAEKQQDEALLELEKLLGYDFTPFDPADAFRVHQKRIKPEDLRLPGQELRASLPSSQPRSPPAEQGQPMQIEQKSPVNQNFGTAVAPSAATATVEPPLAGTTNVTGATNMIHLGNRAADIRPPTLGSAPTAGTTQGVVGATAAVPGFVHPQAQQAGAGSAYVQAQAEVSPGMVRRSME
ncbi:unnamed protein product [Amoebophrya sp. A120]|nr:unnamed protein product [Amoebophrya sp. A120]|eukprot:GSA120T00009057001.1